MIVFSHLHRITLQKPGKSNGFGEKFSNYKEIIMLGIQSVLNVLTALTAIDYNKNRYYSRTAILISRGSRPT